MKQVFAQRLMEIRTDNMLSQRDMAQILHVSQVAVCRWEQGVNSPNIEALYRICKAFDVTADYML